MKPLRVPSASRAALAAGLSLGLVPSVLPAAASAAPVTPAPVAAAPAVGSSAAGPDRLRYYRQTLRWSRCYQPNTLLIPEEERLECASMLVPLDWRTPDARQDLRVEVSRLRPLRGTPTRSIVGNPGGPGGPGIIMPLLLAERPAVAARAELVGFDPRGTGRSTSVSCEGAPSPFALDPRDRDAASLALTAELSRSYAEVCRRKNGSLLDVITTEQTVRDMDLVRHLLGRRTLDFLGYSGGSWLGAHYATTFPDRVGRFVLDSNTQFTGPWRETFELQPLGFERRFRQDFAPWAARYDLRLRLGRTPSRVRGTYERLRAELRREPLDVEIFPTLTIRIDGAALDNAIAQSLYSKTQFTDLALELRAVRALVAARGNAAARARVLRGLSPGQRERLVRAVQERPRRTGRPLALDSPEATFFAVICNDTPWPQGQAYADRVSGEQGRRYPLVGWSLNQNPCYYWDRPATSLPTPTGRGVPPVLMVQSQRDPATPIEGARRAHARFAGSRMLTVTNEGDHGVYVGVNPCVDRRVDAFFLTGALPAARDTTCPGTGIPAPAVDRDLGPQALGRPSGGVFDRIRSYQERLDRG